jgi:hypothetical protein
MGIRARLKPGAPAADLDTRYSCGRAVSYRLDLETKGLPT